MEVAAPEAPEARKPRWVGGQAQWKETEKPDFRHAVLGPKGHKERNLKRRLEQEEQAELDAAAMDADAGPGPSSDSEQDKHSKRRKAEGMPFIPVSGRTWKAPAQRASTVMKHQNKNTSWEKKMSEKNKRTTFLEQKKEAVDAAKAKRKAASDQRKAARERKLANRDKSEVVQKITNSATLKKMMKNKKQKKLLKKKDTTVVDKS